MVWKNIEDELPQYYECVFAYVKNVGEEVEVWRASNGNANVWTEFGTDKAYYDEDILGWRPYDLKEKI